jgi:phospholipid transport system transporter-binding protein
MTAPRFEDLGNNNWQLSGDLIFGTVAGLVNVPDFGDQHGGIIRIDLAGVTRAESVGLALLLEWQRVAEARGISIAYVNMPAQMQSIAGVCGLEEILQSA